MLGREESARYLLVLDEAPQESPAIRVVQRLRERMPTLLEDAGIEEANVSFAGDTALAEETVDTISRDLVRIGAAAFLVNFLLLVLFLRAVLAPLYLVLASTLALAASIGLTTLVFQGFLGHDDLTYHVPFAVAVLLLSLGSDYNVFVVGRIWKHAERMPLREAIATAAPSASRAITVAGLALAFSFAALALIDLRSSASSRSRCSSASSWTRSSCARCSSPHSSRCSASAAGGRGGAASWGNPWSPTGSLLDRLRGHTRFWPPGRMNRPPACGLRFL